MVSSTAFSETQHWALPAGVLVVKSVSRRDSLAAPTRPLVNRCLSDCLVDFSDHDYVGELGRGSLCVVERFRNRRTGLDLAIKSFYGNRSPGLDWKTIFIREIEILLKLDHPCIVRLFGYSMPTENCPAQLATLFIDGCSLSDVLRGVPVWWTPTAKSITIVGIIVGMKYVHSRGIIHRDLKPGNILIDNENHQVHICDFGSSRLCSVDSTLTKQVGTSQYMAPEMYEDVEYDFKVDIFSFGLILYEILTGNAVFPTRLSAHQVMRQAVLSIRPGIPDNVPPSITLMIQACWSIDPAARPSFPDILRVLEEVEFNVCEGVNSEHVRSFIESIKNCSRSQSHADD
jgi:serine/threonine protein kinase